MSVVLEMVEGDLVKIWPAHRKIAGVEKRNMVHMRSLQKDGLLMKRKIKGDLPIYTVIVESLMDL